MTEMERALRLARRVNLFWLVVSLATLIFSLGSAAVRTPGLLTSWRGAALLALSAVYVWWIAGRALQAWCAGPRPDAGQAVLKANTGRNIRTWLVALGLTAGLFALHPMMGWLTYTLFGMAFSMFELPWAALPGLIAYLIIPTTLFANGFIPLQLLSDPWFLASWGLTFPIYAAMVYFPARLMRDRVRREAGMAELEQMHRELSDAHERLAASADQERELAVLRERARLARDMHDTLGHALVLVAVKLEAAQRLRGVDATRADRELAATQEVVRQAMGDFRASLDALRSPSQPCEPLAATLARRAREAAQRAGWRVIYDVSPDLGDLDLRVHEALLRVGTEALTNAERHARARTVTLSLRPAPADAVLLRVADDGVGPGAWGAAGHTQLHAESTPARERTTQAEGLVGGHYGITGMRERVEAQGGDFAITPAPLRGTVVEARVPAHPYTPPRVAEGPQESAAISTLQWGASREASATAPEKRIPHPDLTPVTPS